MNDDIDKLIAWLNGRKDRDATTTISLLSRKVRKLYDRHSKASVPDWYN